MTLIQWVSLGCSLVFTLLVVAAVRRRLLQEAYAILWVAAGLAMIVLSVWTRLLDFLSLLVGTKLPAFALILALIMGILLLLFQLTIVISLHERKIRLLAEELALLRNAAAKPECDSAKSTDRS